MAALDQTDADNIINATTGAASYPSVSSVKVRLMATVGSSTADGTELANGGGYTTGGTTMAFGSASAGSATNTGTASWTNSSASAWTINGLEIWDTAGTPLRHWFGSFTGAPITIAVGNTFALAASSITLSLS